MRTRSSKTCTQSLPELLNRDCHCIAVDEGLLHRQLESELGGERGKLTDLLGLRPHLLSPSPVYVAREQVEGMAAVIRAVEAVVGHGEYRRRALGAAPAIARHDPGPGGVFFGYDFHLTDGGPKLIEINTNAGGALLSLHLARAQRGCCPEVDELVLGSLALDEVGAAVVAMFRREHERQRGPGVPLRRVAVVDDDPEEQFLYPELLLFARLFERAGIDVQIADPRELELQAGDLYLNGHPLDLVYNRLTDFYLSQPEHAALTEAYRQGGVVVTPAPHHHALYANKRNLAWLSDAELLREWGIEAGPASVLLAGLPKAEVVQPERADELWAARRRLFFKPLSGFGSRGTYRGDKLTRRVWQSILASDYLAQETIPPSQRLVVVDGDSRPLKLDVRCYVYEGRIQLLGARLYQGQATNLRTEGGGLATVFTTPA